MYEMTMKKNKVKAFYNPFAFIQAAGKHAADGISEPLAEFRWSGLSTMEFPSMPVANGAWGMGCIGYPGHPVWEVTGACNLRCIHCHATSGQADADELTTDEGKS